MKALITAGGRATRLRPITQTINKHLLPLANKPLIFYAIEKIANTGIKEIGININKGDATISAVVGDGSRWGVRITYIEQKGGALGLAHIIKNARDEGFLDGPFLMYLGDNIILGSINRFVERFKKENLSCMLALSKVKDPSRFGVPEIGSDGSIISVTEKPTSPKSPFAITGIYLFDEQVLGAVSDIKPSARGEMEITDAISYYLDNNLSVGYEEISGWWKDTGKPADLLEGNLLLLREMGRDDFGIDCVIPDNVRIQGSVSIGKGCLFEGEVLIRGPVIIGRDCTIKNSYIGPYTAVGEETTVADTEIENSIVLQGATLACGGRVVDSLIGKRAHLKSVNSSLPRGRKMILGDNTFIEL